MPPELQREVYAEVGRTRRRSRWSVRRTLRALGVSVSSYYRWLRDDAWSRERAAAPPVPLQPYEALPEEKEVVRAYALKHPELRHRALAWRMVDDDIACLSPSTVYRILRSEELVCPWRRRKKRRREEEEKAGRPDEIWATDLKYVAVGERNYYLISFLDEYSRYIVHHELLRSMDGHTVSVAAQAALETLSRGPDGRLLKRPAIRSDNGSGYISREFGGVLDEYGLSHRRITPHCPEENGLIERAQRTFDEALDGVDFENYLQAADRIAKMIRWYNEERLHSALGFLRPVDYYRGRPEILFEERRRKLAHARHRRKEMNLRLRQRTLPLERREVVA
jgi:transposase InsO family protein